MACVVGFGFGNRKLPQNPTEWTVNSKPGFSSTAARRGITWHCGTPSIQPSNTQTPGRSCWPESRPTSTSTGTDPHDSRTTGTYNAGGAARWPEQDPHGQSNRGEVKQYQTLVSLHCHDRQQIIACQSRPVVQSINNFRPINIYAMRYHIIDCRWQSVVRSKNNKSPPAGG